MGCDFAQGYLYARPLPYEGVTDLLSAVDGPSLLTRPTHGVSLGGRSPIPSVGC